MDNWGRSGRKTLLVMLCLIAAAVCGGVTTAQHAPASFSEAKSVEQQGDVMSIPVSLSETDKINLKVSSADGAYSVSLDVVDGNNDGTVVVLVDTSKANYPEHTYYTDDAGDSVTVITEDSDIESKILPTGRYNIILSTDSTRIASVRWLTEPTVHGSESYTLPEGTSLSKSIEQRFEQDDSSNSSKALEVAAGDLMVANFRLSGIESKLHSEKPGEKTVFAKDSSPSVKTTHVLQLSAKQPIHGQKISLNYDRAPSFRGQPLIQNIGIDTNSNGEIDRSLKPVISGYKTTTDGELTVSFDKDVVVTEGETLLLQYRVSNPNTSNSNIRISFGEYTTTETVNYGLVGNGTLGSGIDLQISGNNTQFVSPLMAVRQSYSADTDTLTAVTRTNKLSPGTYTLSLSVDSRTYPTKERVILNESFIVSRPTVRNFTVTGSNKSISVNAQTNYAPKTPLVIQLSSDDNHFQYMSRYTESVTRNRTVSTNINVPPMVSGKVNVTIRYKNETVAGPTEYLVSE